MGNGSPFSAELHQAQGMVSVQAGCTMDEALELLRDRAMVEGLSLKAIAAGVIDRTIRFGE
jgi:AmiR/NasT family two-component response regulator